MNTKAADRTASSFAAERPTVHCLACVPLPASGTPSCDAACLADFTTTKHALWACLDPRSCSRLAPATASAVAWKPWLHWVNAAGTTAEKAAFHDYAVREQPLVGTTIT